MTTPDQHSDLDMRDRADDRTPPEPGAAPAGTATTRAGTTAEDDFPTGRTEPGPRERELSGDAGAGREPEGETNERLVSKDRADDFRARWDRVKGEFVDEPREAVAHADALVGELLDEVEQLFREQRRRLDQGLDANESSTEDLRLALRRYRSFFDRLLSF